MSAAEAPVALAGYIPVSLLHKGVRAQSALLQKLNTKVRRSTAAESGVYETV